MRPFPIGKPGSPRPSPSLEGTQHSRWARVINKSMTLIVGKQPTTPPSLRLARQRHDDLSPRPHGPDRNRGALTRADSGPLRLGGRKTIVFVWVRSTDREPAPFHERRRRALRPIEAHRSRKRP